MARPRRAQAELSPAEGIIQFVERYLIVPEGAHVGRPVVMREWQREIIRGVYGAGSIRLAIVSMARKNAKTAMAAMLVLAHLVGPQARRNGQIFSAARSRDQAAVVFGYAAKMVRMSPELNQLVTIRESAKQMVCHLTGVQYRALSADATTAYGLSPVLVVHDELGQVRGPRDELYDALETAMGAQAAPLSIVISTQAPTEADLLSLLIDDAKRGADPRTRLFLYEAPEDADPWVEETWRLANPALGDFCSLEEMQQLAQRAQRLPSFEASFRNLNLNQRVAAAGHLFAPAVWALNSGASDLSVFDDGPVYGGLDLSSRRDLTALVLVAKDADGAVHLWPHFWLPEEGLRERCRQDKVPYDLWAEQGLLTLTPGRTVDYAWVAQRLIELDGQCDLRAVRYDRWRIEDLRKEVDRLGGTVNLEPYGQGFRDASPAIEALEEVVVNGRLRHGEHPILRWNAENTTVKTDPAGNRKPDKGSKGATGRIDGIVALMMAVKALHDGGEPPAPAVDWSTATWA